MNVAFATLTAVTRLCEMGTRLDDFLVGDFFYLWLRRVFPGFLVGRADSICVSEVRRTPLLTRNFPSSFQPL
ncbi:hypothetical protein DPMN_025925 [Dreissena polymorpha]|uniref:Uncharacterized protein n=1 Tax=Dreissena polymorpha TaxID=45954 RepID=A0A9D4RE32_DREPO|nr:hypothetical protein DPMN_025925 [Dreissena polymorpha]